MFYYKRTMVMLLAAVLFNGCNKEQPTESSKNLFGFYESSIFIEPGSADGGLNILSSGGYLQLILNDNNNFTAELFIPAEVASNYPKGISTYDGKYVIIADTIKFSAFDFIVEKIRWNKENGQLETFEVPMRGQPFKIVLNRYMR